MSEALFQLGQKALIINEKNEVLMVGSDSHSHPGKLWWDLPGGRVDEDEESLSEALDRELQEELQIAVDVHDLLLITIPKKRTDGKPRVLLAIYHCSIRSGDPMPAHEVKDFKWINISDIPEIPESRYSKDTIEIIRSKLDIN